MGWSKGTAGPLLDGSLKIVMGASEKEDRVAVAIVHVHPPHQEATPTFAMEKFFS
jgi:hypothetical protein